VIFQPSSLAPAAARPSVNKPLGVIETPSARVAGPTGSADQYEVQAVLS